MFSRINYTETFKFLGVGWSISSFSRVMKQYRLQFLFSKFMLGRFLFTALSPTKKVKPMKRVYESELGAIEGHKAIKA